MKAKIITLFTRLYYLSLLILIVFAIIGAGYASGKLRKIEVKEIEKIIEVPEEDPSLEELLSEAPRHGMPKIIARVLMEKEDSSRFRKNAKRCEWQSKEWLNIATKIEPNDTEQRDAYRCSYGPFQVAGWHAVKYGMVWSDLLDLRKNLEVSAAVWGNCYEESKERNKKFSKAQHVRYAFRCYNGSGLMAENYANSAMAILGGFAIEELSGEL